MCKEVVLCVSVCVCVCVCVCVFKIWNSISFKAEMYPGKKNGRFARGSIKVQKKEPNKGSIGFVSEKLFCKFSVEWQIRNPVWENKEIINEEMEIGV